jgi:hypothetical protein
MDVHNVWFLADQEQCKLLTCITGPHSLFHQSYTGQAGIRVNFVITSPVGHDFVSVALEHELLLLKYDVLSARLLIRIVYDQNFHYRSPLVDEFRCTRLQHVTGMVNKADKQSLSCQSYSWSCKSAAPLSTFETNPLQRATSKVSGKPHSFADRERVGTESLI